jgi:ABC-type Zn uptake system ZnuABC Zn-binding protein ZnuA
MRMRTVLVSLLLAASPVLAACGSGGEEGADRPRVVATTGIVADIAQQVAGPEIEVEQVIPDGSSPHDFQLSARDRQGLEEADLLLVNGAGLEAGLPLDDIGGPQWALTEHVGELLPFEERTASDREESDHPGEAGDHVHGDGADHGHDGDQGHDHGPNDPHVWMDPTRVARALPALAAALARIDPAGAAGYRERA